MTEIPAGEMRDYIYEAFAAMPAGDRRNSHWVMDGEWVTDLLQMDDLDGRSLWQPNFSLAAPQTLLGLPIEIRKGGGAPHLER